MDRVVDHQIATTPSMDNYAIEGIFVIPRSLKLTLSPIILNPHLSLPIFQISYCHSKYDAQKHISFVCTIDNIVTCISIR